MSLYQKWLKLKEEEKRANEARIAVEAELYTMFQAQIESKVSGVTTIQDGEFILKVDRKLDRKFNQDQLAALAREYQLPFKTEFKIGSNDLKSLDSNLLDKVLACSTTKYNKPSFTVIKEEE